MKQANAATGAGAGGGSPAPARRRSSSPSPPPSAVTRRSSTPPHSPGVTTKSSNGRSKSLSKDDLYAPLSLYTNPPVSAGAGDADRLARVVRNRCKNLKEHLVCDYVETVSRAYTGVDPNVTVQSLTTFSAPGESALKRHYVDSRLKQRSLTLLGGGIAAPSPSQAGGRKRGRGGGGGDGGRTWRPVGSLSNRERRRRMARRGGAAVLLFDLPPTLEEGTAAAAAAEATTGEEPRGVPSATSAAAGSEATADAPATGTASALRELNRSWGGYAGALVDLCRGGAAVAARPPSSSPVRSKGGAGRRGRGAKDGRDGDGGAPVDRRLLSRILSQQGSRLELCGAAVRVVRCPSRPGCVDVDGMVVQETPSTWRLVAFAAAGAGERDYAGGMSTMRQPGRRRRRKEKRNAAATAAGGDDRDTPVANGDELEGEGRKPDVYDGGPQRLTAGPMPPRRTTPIPAMRLMVLPKRGSTLAVRMAEDVVVLVEGDGRS